MRIELLHLLRLKLPPFDRTPTWVWVVHSLCLVLYIADIVVHLIFFGKAAFINVQETKVVKAEFALVCFFIVDFIILIVQDLVQTVSSHMIFLDQHFLFVFTATLPVLNEAKI